MRFSTMQCSFSAIWNPRKLTFFLATVDFLLLRNLLYVFVVTMLKKLIQSFNYVLVLLLLLLLFLLVFLVSGFYESQDSKIGGRPNTPLCNFHLLHKQLDISRTITTYSLPLHIAISDASRRILVPFKRYGRPRKVLSIFATRYSRVNQIKLFKGCFPQISLCPLLNTWTQFFYSYFM